MVNSSKDMTIQAGENVYPNGLCVHSCITSEVQQTIPFSFFLCFFSKEKLKFQNSGIQNPALYIPA